MKTKKIIKSGKKTTDVSGWDSDKKKNIYILSFATKEPIKNIKDLSSGNIKPIKYIYVTYCGGPRYWMEKNILRETQGGEIIEALIESLYPEEIPVKNIKKEIEFWAKKDFDK